MISPPLTAGFCAKTYFGSEPKPQILVKKRKFWLKNDESEICYKNRFSVLKRELRAQIAIFLKKKTRIFNKNTNFGLETRFLSKKCEF